MKKTLLYVLLSAIAALQAAPFLWLALFSFKSNSEIVNGSAWSLPDEWRFGNYAIAWEKASFASYFMNSLFVTVVSLFFVLLFGSMMAYALTRMNFRFSQAAQMLLLTGVMVPVHATLIPLFILLKDFGLLKSHLAVILPYIAVNLPIGVFIVSGFLRNLPRELEESAFLDGCGVLRSFFRILLPVLRPVLATLAIFTFLAVWNELLMAVTFIQKSSLRTIPLGLMSFKGVYSVEWGPLGAAMVISALPILGVFAIFSEQMERSFTAGAILK
jgi:raffinose/stachyose/melibiose transport system permease protein